MHQPRRFKPPIRWESHDVKHFDCTCHFNKWYGLTRRFCQRCETFDIGFYEFTVDKGFMEILLKRQMKVTACSPCTACLVAKWVQFFTLKSLKLYFVLWDSDGFDPTQILILMNFMDLTPFPHIGSFKLSWILWWFVKKANKHVDLKKNHRILTIWLIKAK